MSISEEGPQDQVVSAITGIGGKTGITYVVKFADVTSKPNVKELEIFRKNKPVQVPGKIVKPDVGKDLKDRDKDGACDPNRQYSPDGSFDDNYMSYSPQVVTNSTRSRRKVKIPKRLLEDDASIVSRKKSKVTDSKVNKDKTNALNSIKTKELQKAKGLEQDVKNIELPRISFHNLSKTDLLIEIEINSNLEVGPFELLEEMDGKSKYGIKISKDNTCKNDNVSIEDGREEEEIIQENTNFKEEDIYIPDCNVKETLPKKSVSLGSLLKIKAKLAGEEHAPKKKLKKRPIVKKNSKKITVKTEKPTEPDTKLTDDSKESVGPDNEAVNEVNNQADDLEQELSNPVEQDAKLTQTELIKLETDVKNGEKMAPKKSKKKMDDSKPRRKYMKRNAYSHDSNHYTVITNDEGTKLHKCKICGLELKSRGSVRDHVRTHTGETPFVCDVCGKGFGNQGNYNKHYPLHSLERPHVCELCGMSYKLKRLLTLHMRRHNGIRAHICQHCGKGFFTSTELGSHMHMHSNQKNFACRICEKLFTYKDSLRRHESVHMGKGQHQCHLCGDVFTRRNYFLKHLVKKHEVPEDSVERLIPKRRTGRVVMSEDAHREHIERAAKQELDLENAAVVVHPGADAAEDHVNDTEAEPVYLKLEEGNFAVKFIKTSEDASTVYLETVDSNLIELGDKSVILEDGIHLLSQDGLTTADHGEVLDQEDSQQVQFVVTEVQTVTE